MANKMEVYSLSCMQSALIAQESYITELNDNITQVVFECYGNVDAEILSLSWQKIVTIHSILRTEFNSQKNKVCFQYTLDSVEVPFEFIDWTQIKPIDRKKKLNCLLEKKQKKGFILTKAPIFDLVLIQLSEDNYYSIWSYHSLLINSLSFSIMLRDLLGVYKALKENKMCFLKPSKPYKDYVAWLEQQDLNNAKNFWENYLGCVKPCPFRFRTMISPDNNKNYDFYAITFSDDETNAIKKFLTQNNLTISTLFQSIIGAIISIYTQQEDVILGISCSEEKTNALNNDMLGVFSNILPLRINYAVKNSFYLFLHNLQNQVFKINQFFYTPLVQIKSWVRTDEELFDVVLFCEDCASREFDDINNSFTLRKKRFIQNTKYPLVIAITYNEQITLHLNYKTLYFDEALITLFSEHIRNLLKQIISSNLDSLNQSKNIIAWFKEKTRLQILAKLNDNKISYPLNKCIHQLFEEQVIKTPYRTAVSYDNVSLTYESLNAKANQLAHYLREKISNQALVGVYIDRSLDLIIALLAVFKAGGAYVPIDTSYPDERKAIILEDANVSLILTQTYLNTFFSNQKFLVICLDTSWDIIATKDNHNLFLPIDSRNLSSVIYTSGSTGKPKGVMNTHLGLTNKILWMQDLYGLQKDDKVLQKTPIGFDVSGWEFFWPLICGAELVIARPGGHQDTQYLIQVIVEKSITTIHFVPPMLQAFLASAGFDQCKSLKRVFCSGDALRLETQEKFFNSLPCCELYNLYGPTEASIEVTAWKCNPASLLTTIPIGHSMPNNQLYILDQALEPVPVGIPGELFIGGVQVARGYFNKPDLTAEKFIADPFSVEKNARLYKTGDLARYLSDGSIEFLGRIDAQVKIRGVRIELGEIETALARHHSVESCIVVARREQSGEKQLVAYIVPNYPISISQLRGFLKNHLLDVMLPSQFVFLQELPLSVNGKIDRSKLPSPNLEGSKNRFANNQFEQQLTEIWREILQINDINHLDNFFEIGGNSIKAIFLVESIRNKIGVKLSIADIFENPSIQSLAYRLILKNASFETFSTNSNINHINEHRFIAVVGMACRFPGAENIDQFWSNLIQEKESIVEFSEADLIANGVTPNLLSQPNYIRARPILADIKSFDANFFNYSRKEAEIIDPQQRMFLECSWHALEDAGHVPDKYKGEIGVFAGCDNSFYLSNNLGKSVVGYEALDDIPLMLGNNNDYLATRTAYKLNLRGPAITIQTACSTSLVTIHLAIQSLLTGDCNMAIAGGVAVRSLDKIGYEYQEGTILSPDGHCHAFDSEAGGTLFGHGVGVVVLKSLESAIKDRNTIRAIIRGSAVNNDGAKKAAFTAPSSDGQACVIAKCHQYAGITADSISYVEAHGTGTKIGDPIEVAALTKAFRLTTAEKQFCALGSVKTNIGHLAHAAGAASFIKTVLALENRILPASLNYKRPNPEIDFSDSPFYVNQKSVNWESSTNKPRRAGVSSFGFGGTNAHVVLEEPPKKNLLDPTRKFHLLPISAKSIQALNSSRAQLSDWLEKKPDTRLEDLAFTLQEGRCEFAYRSMIVAENIPNAIQKLKLSSNFIEIPIHNDSLLTFMFSGQGSKFVNVAKSLFTNEIIFAKHFNECSELFQKQLNINIKEVIYPTHLNSIIQDPVLSQPAIFTIQYALLKMWESWGIKPHAVIGHSFGEYIAAYAAGVLSLENAVKILAERALLCQSLPAGAMLVVNLGANAITEFLTPELSIAAFNSNTNIMISGSIPAIQELKVKLQKRRIPHLRLHGNRAYHSFMVEPILAQLKQTMTSIEFRPPTIPWMSTVYGRWITDKEATQSEYWLKNLRQPVMFDKAITRLLKCERRIMLEVGTGQTLVPIVRKHQSILPNHTILSSLPNYLVNQLCEEHVQTVLGKLWLIGLPINWRQYNSYQKSYRISLPTYPFQREYFWKEIKNCSNEITSYHKQNSDISDWFYTPWWKPSVAAAFTESKAFDQWLVLIDKNGFGSKVIEFMRRQGKKVWAILLGPEDHKHFSNDGLFYILSSTDKANYQTMLEACCLQGTVGIINFCNLDSFDTSLVLPSPEPAATKTFLDLFHLIQAIGERDSVNLVHITVICKQLFAITPQEEIASYKSTILGPILSAAKEYPNISCRCIDIGSDSSSQLIEQLVQEATYPYAEPLIAYRRNQRLVRVFEPIKLPSPAQTISYIRENGVYLITGGLGGLGIILAKHIVLTRKARVILISRSAPHFNTIIEVEKQINSLESSNLNSSLSTLNELGDKVLTIPVDVTDAENLKKALRNAEQKFGVINGVIHAAGIAGKTMMQIKTQSEAINVMRPKINGANILNEIFADKQLDFFVLFSSISSIAPNFGQSDYCSANAYLDNFAHDSSRNQKSIISINWDVWTGVGMAVDDQGILPQSTIKLEKGIEAFERILQFIKYLTQIIVCPIDINQRIQLNTEQNLAALIEQKKLTLHSETKLKLQDKEKTSNFNSNQVIEIKLYNIWESVLGASEFDSDTSFFALGGDSLTAIQVITRIKQEFNVKIILREFFKSPTIANLANIISAKHLNTSTLNGIGLATKTIIL